MFRSPRFFVSLRRKYNITQAQRKGYKQSFFKETNNKTSSSSSRTVSNEIDEFDAFRNILIILAFGNLVVLRVGYVTVCHGPSMLPTVALEGDIGVVDTLRLTARGVRRGDVVIAMKPESPINERVCKRVTAIEGDTVVYYKRFSPTPIYVEVPPGHVWLSGDNPMASNDSRNYGPVASGMILGVLTLKFNWRYGFSWTRHGLPDRIRVDGERRLHHLHNPTTWDRTNNIEATLKMTGRDERNLIGENEIKSNKEKEKGVDSESVTTTRISELSPAGPNALTSAPASAPSPRSSSSTTPNPKMPIYKETPNAPDVFTQPSIMHDPFDRRDLLKTSTSGCSIESGPGCIVNNGGDSAGDCVAHPYSRRSSAGIVKIGWFLVCNVVDILDRIEDFIKSNLSK
jgi:mitochondrial inner membrane protease subunit 1